jgi:hypothetical protein
MAIAPLMNKAMSSVRRNIEKLRDCEGHAHLVQRVPGNPVHAEEKVIYNSRIGSILHAEEKGDACSSCAAACIPADLST